MVCLLTELIVYRLRDVECKWTVTFIGSGRLGPRGEIFFQDSFSKNSCFFTKNVFFPKQKFFFKKKNLIFKFVSNNSFFLFFFSKKNNFFNVFFEKRIFLSNKSFFQSKTFFKQKSITSIKMLIFSEFFIWQLSRGIVRIESAGKRAAKRKSRAMTGWKRIDERASFVYNL